jgi:diaminopimelate epimerase
MIDGPSVMKMSGAGNDFLVLGPDAAGRIPGDLSQWVRQVCRRRLSVGADGVVLVEPAGVNRVRVRYFNADGSSAFCGNGSRCAARFACLTGLTGDELILESEIGELHAEVYGSSVRLVLPPPRDAGATTLALENESIEGRVIDAGVPHFVIFVARVGEAPLERWGPPIRRHPRFAPAGTNVDLVALAADGTLELRTWERGVEGETLACGSGAVAAALAVRMRGGRERSRVLPASGIPLEVELPGPAQTPEAAILTGDARLVFEARLAAEAPGAVPGSVEDRGR